MRNPGIIIKMNDGRHGIVYNNQPLAPARFIITLCDADFNVMMKDNKPQILVRDDQAHRAIVATSRLIGFVD